MEIGDKIIVGSLGQQPLHLTDASIDPQHAFLTRKDADTYVLEDNHSAKGVWVFGLRIVRKTIQADTPFRLGTCKLTVRRLLTDARRVDLAVVWRDYERQKRRWDRYSALVNSIRMLTPILSMLVTQLVGQNWMVTGVVLLVVTGVSILAGEKVLERKTLAMAKLQARMQTEYACPHCHQPFQLVPWSVIRGRGYCPNPACGVPLK